MDRDVWQTTMAAIQRAARRVKEPGCRKPLYPNWLIVAMYLWSVWHDRCLSWACDRGHYGGLFRPRGKLPSVSRFSRRVKTDAVQAILGRVHEELRACGLASDVGYFDGKPLVVSPVSKDPDAARGKVSGGFAKSERNRRLPASGYKLHAYVNEHRRIAVWSVTPLNVAEPSVALALTPHLPPVTPQEVVLADSNYDSAPLHRALAEGGRAMLSPLRGCVPLKLDSPRRAKTLREMGPARAAAVALWERCPGLARQALKRRNNVEGVFSVLVCAAGLGPPPAFVRRLDRVTRWTGAKIILYHARLLAQERAAA